jgi:hypothetical protein
MIFFKNFEIIHASLSFKHVPIAAAGCNTVRPCIAIDRVKIKDFNNGNERELIVN